MIWFEIFLAIWLLGIWVIIFFVGIADAMLDDGERAAIAFWPFTLALLALTIVIGWPWIVGDMLRRSAVKRSTSDLAEMPGYLNRRNDVGEVE